METIFPNLSRFDSPFLGQANLGLLHELLWTR